MLRKAHLFFVFAQAHLLDELLLHVLVLRLHILQALQQRLVLIA
mgnify:CR=1 FL=1